MNRRFMFRVTGEALWQSAAADAAPLRKGLKRGMSQTSASQQLEARGGALEAKREGTKGTKRREETGAGRRIEEAAAVSDEAKRNNHQTDS